MHTLCKRQVLFTLALLLPAGLVVWQYVVPAWRSSLAGKDDAPNTTTSDPFGEYTLVHHRRDNPNFPSTLVHQPNTPLDSCRILIDCYPEADSQYVDLETCHKKHPKVFDYFDSSALLYKGQLVGFLSLDFRVNRADPAQVAINIYNVCVDRRFRSRGLGRLLVERSVDEAVKFYNLTRNGRRVLLGLDVNLSTKYAVHSFVLYAKMGFLRGWQPCHTIMDVDWRPFFHPSSSSSRPELGSPLDALLRDPKQYQEDEIKGEGRRPRLPLFRSRKGEAMDHYCMFKWYGESWATLGEIIAAPFGEKILAKKDDTQQ